MSETPLLRDLLIVFAAALPIVGLFQRWQLPPLLGFMVAGAAIGPHGVGWIEHTEAVQAIAELGLVLLLFVVGLELSLRSLVQLGRSILLAGSGQIVVTAAVGALAAHALGFDATVSLLAGLILVHSSTAIPLKVFGERKELDSLHARITLGIALIQDLSLLPMVLLVRSFAQVQALSWADLAQVVLQSIVALGLIFAGAWFLLPRLLAWVVELRSREIFSGTIVLVALGTAWLAAQLGLSLALGAFIAGLVVSESEYSHAVIADVLPFRDTLNSVFFISVGMLVPVGEVLASPLPYLALGGAVLTVKALLAAFFVWVLYRSARIAVLAGTALASMSELGFVLLLVALEQGLLSPSLYEQFCGLAVLTMIPLPFLMSALPRAWNLVERRLGRLPSGTAEASLEVAPQVVVIGYGLNGENLGRVLQATAIPFVVVELDPRRAQLARERGLRVVFGDATRPAVLAASGVTQAQVVVVAISDAHATRRIVAQVRALNRDVPLIVRTRYVAEIEGLRELGATEVIPEEFETSVEIFARVLRRLRVPRNIINAQIDLIRQEGYRMLRGLELPRQTLDQLDAILAATTTESFLIAKHSPLCGRTLRDLRLRKVTGATVIAIVRGGKPITNPEPDEPLQAGDILVLVGSHEQLDRALKLLEEPTSEAPS